MFVALIMFGTVLFKVILMYIFRLCVYGALHYVSVILSCISFLYWVPGMWSRSRRLGLGAICLSLVPVGLVSGLGSLLGTNLIHDFTAVTFSVKLTFFREKR